MTVDEYHQWFIDAGFKRTGESTLLTEEWSNAAGTFIMVTRAEELSASDRVAAIERFTLYLGIDFPPGGRGVH